MWYFFSISSCAFSFRLRVHSNGEEKYVLCFSYFWFSHQNAFVLGPEASLANAILGEEPSSYGNTKPGGPLVPQRIFVL